VANFGERRKGEVHVGMKESLHRTGPIGPGDAKGGKLISGYYALEQRVSRKRS
jgi:hypothetical protein